MIIKKALTFLVFRIVPFRKACLIMLKNILIKKALALLLFSFFFLPVFSVQALVLDWSGSYELELNVLQKGDFEQWGASEMFHNLRLKPDIKAFDNVRLRSWFQIATAKSGNTSLSQSHTSSGQSNPKKYLPQEGYLFGLGENADFLIPFLSVRDLYLEVAHDFGLFQAGLKPHHFGLGMYYNDSSEPFSPVYNKEGSTGFISWRGFIGSSYYVQPMIHYLEETVFSFFIQLGFTKEEYGVEAMYKTAPQNLLSSESLALDSPSYFGLYGYYEMQDLILRLEVGGAISEEVYGGALSALWHSPLKWLDVELNAGVSTSEGDKSFYFDPSFSSLLFSLISEYETLKSKKPEYLASYLQYSIHSALYVSSAVSFSLLDSLSLKPVFSIHLAYPGMAVSIYHTELELKYQLTEGLFWNTSLGIIFPGEDHFHVGAISQVAVTF